MADKRKSVTARLAELGVALPPCPAPLGAYVPTVRDGGLIYTSGMLPMADGVLTLTGPVGPGGHPAERGAEAARLCALNALAAIAAELGGVEGLERVARVIQVTGHVLSAPGFADQPQVLNGASDFLFQVFGERGRHTRMALGAAALPRGASVELAVVVRVEP